MATNTAAGMYTNALTLQEVEQRRLNPRPNNSYWWNGFEALYVSIEPKKDAQKC